MSGPVIYCAAQVMPPGLTGGPLGRTSLRFGWQPPTLVTAAAAGTGRVYGHPWIEATEDDIEAAIEANWVATFGVDE